MPHKGGRDEGDVSTSQGMPRIAGNQWKVGERPGADPTLEPPEGAHHADTLILDLTSKAMRA